MTVGLGRLDEVMVGGRFASIKLPPITREKARSRSIAVSGSITDHEPCGSGTSKECSLIITVLKAGLKISSLKYIYSIV